MVYPLLDQSLLLIQGFSKKIYIFYFVMTLLVKCHDLVIDLAGRPMTMRKNYTTIILSHFRWWKRIILLWLGNWRSLGQSWRTLLVWNVDMVLLLTFYLTFFGIILSSLSSLNLLLIFWWLHVGGPYGTTPNNEIEASGNAAGQNTYEDGYGVAQVCHIFHFLVFMNWCFVFEFVVLLSFCMFLTIDIEGEAPFNGPWCLFPT